MIISFLIKFLFLLILLSLFKAERLERVTSQTPHEVSWTPLLWAMKLLARAKSDGKITIEAPCYANLQASFEKIESVNRKLLKYAWGNFPLAYTQVCFLIINMDESTGNEYYYI